MISGAELEDAVTSAAAAVKNSFITEKVPPHTIQPTRHIHSLFLFIAYHQLSSQSITLHIIIRHRMLLFRYIASYIITQFHISF